MADDVVRTVIEAVDNASAVFDKVGDSADKLTSSLDKVNQTEGEGSAASQDLAAKGSDLTGTLAGIAAGATALYAAMKTAFDFSVEGANINRIQEQFKASAESIGLNAEEMLAKMSAAVRGTVDDEALAQVATRAFTQGIITNGETMVRVLELARAKGILLGQDTQAVVENIIQSTDMLSERGFKRLGINLEPLTKLVADYAKAHGVAASSIDTETQKTILLQAALDKSKTAIDNANVAVDDQLTKIQRLETGWQEFWDSIKSHAADVMVGFIDDMTIMGELADRNVPTLKKLTDATRINGDAMSGWHDQLGGAVDALTKEYIAEQANIQLRERLIPVLGIVADLQNRIANTSQTERQAITLTTDQIKAQDEAAKAAAQSAKDLAAAQQALAKAGEEAAVGQASLYQSLVKVTKADLAKQQIDGLTAALKAGTIGTGAYNSQVEAIDLKYGLATKSSIAMAKGIDYLNDRLKNGTLSPQQYAAAFDKLPAATAAGILNVSKLGLAFDAPITKVDKLDQDMSTKLAQSASNVQKSFDQVGSRASQAAAGATTKVDALHTSLVKLTDHTWMVNIDIIKNGSLPVTTPVSATPGFATGSDFVVPSGYPNDSYNMRVQSGERVIIQTPAQQIAQSSKPGLIDNSTHNTTINDPLSASIWLTYIDGQRRSQLNGLM